VNQGLQTQLLPRFVSPLFSQSSLLHPEIMQEMETFVAAAGAVAFTVTLDEAIVVFMTGVVIVVTVVFVVGVATGATTTGVVIVVLAAGRDPLEMIVVLLPGRIVMLLTPALKF